MHSFVLLTGDLHALYHIYTMKPIYCLLRYLISLFPGRCLQILPRLWRRLALALGLSSSSNQCPVRPEVPLDTTHAITASHVPGDRVSQGSSFGPSYSLGLDTSDMPQSTAGPEWQIELDGSTIVASPIANYPGSPKLSPSHAEGSVDTSFAPTLPSKGRRYNERSP